MVKTCSRRTYILKQSKITNQPPPNLNINLVSYEDFPIDLKGDKEINTFFYKKETVVVGIALVVRMESELEDTRVV